MRAAKRNGPSVQRVHRLSVIAAHDRFVRRLRLACKIAHLATEGRQCGDPACQMSTTRGSDPAAAVERYQASCRGRTLVCAAAAALAMSDTPPLASAAFVGVGNAALYRCGEAQCRRGLRRRPTPNTVPHAGLRLARFGAAKAMAFVKTIRSISDLRARVLARLAARWR
jgi:hypothetical protein